MIVCLASLTAGIAELSEVAPRLATVSPRVVVEPRGVMWCDAQGLDACRMARNALEIVRGVHSNGPHPPIGPQSATRTVIADACAGVARTAIAAEVAAVARASQVTFVQGGAVTVVPPGGDAGFLASYPIEVLGPSPHLCSLLRGSGVESCGDLAALDHESVEVRFAAEGSRIWRLARADDRRRLFPPLQRTLPGASFEWLDYVLSEPERLIFVINGLMASVCAQLGDRGAGAREMALVFSLANRTTYEHRLRPARVTVSQRAWMRLVRSELERIELPDAVTGISLSVLSMGGELERQGDLFDRGFASARATEQALAQLLDDHGSRLLTSRNSAHPLAEKRTEWMEQDATAATLVVPHASQAEPRLALQLMAEPRVILVETERRRDHEIPIRCCLEDGWEDVVSAAGPDRVSGGEWEAPFEREYYRCVTTTGRMVWLFRSEAKWRLAGWWD
ncbi:MAG TPA: hypothetical protein VMM17_12370 [Gemmatimonadaceae bacterium]|nr:hypothetical protein [Gemmatimonadaceae bacterium]